jgi:integrase
VQGYGGCQTAHVPRDTRGLGARIYRAQGTPEGAIQALMTHAHRRTTQIYLDRGAAALTDDDYQAVVAPLTLQQMLGAKGTN